MAWHEFYRVLDSWERRSGGPEWIKQFEQSALSVSVPWVPLHDDGLDGDDDSNDDDDCDDDGRHSSIEGRSNGLSVQLASGGTVRWHAPQSARKLHERKPVLSALAESARKASPPPPERPIGKLLKRVEMLHKLPPADQIGGTEEQRTHTTHWQHVHDAMEFGAIGEDDGLLHVKRHLDGREFVALLNNIDPHLGSDVHDSDGWLDYLRYCKQNNLTPCSGIFAQVYSSGLYSSGLYRYGLYSYGLCSHDFTPCSGIFAQLKSRMLLLRGQRLGNAGLAAVARLVAHCRVRVLDVRENNIVGSEGLRELSWCSMEKESNPLSKELRQLSLSFNPLGIDGIRALASLIKQLGTLEFLLLDAVSLAPSADKAVDVLAEALEMHSTVVVVSLQSNNLDWRCSLCLARMISINTTLQRLDLSFNKIGDDGLRIIGRQLRTNATLLELDLSWNGIGSRGIIELADSLAINKKLSTVMLAHNRP